MGCAYEYAVLGNIRHVAVVRVSFHCVGTVSECVLTLIKIV